MLSGRRFEEREKEREQERKEKREKRGGRRVFFLSSFASLVLCCRRPPLFLSRREVICFLFLENEMERERKRVCICPPFWPFFFYSASLLRRRERERGARSPPPASASKQKKTPQQRDSFVYFPVFSTHTPPRIPPSHLLTKKHLLTETKEKREKNTHFFKTHLQRKKTQKTEFFFIPDFSL